MLAYLRRLDEAVEYLRDNVSMVPTHLEGWETLARVLKESGKAEEAAQALEQANHLLPDNPRLIKPLASLMLESGHFRIAANHYLRLSQLSPNNQDLRLKAGWAFDQCGEHSKARDLYQDALRRSSGTPELWMALAQSCEDLGKREEALEAYQRAHAVKPDWGLPLAAMLGLGPTNDMTQLLAKADKLLSSTKLEAEEYSILSKEVGKVLDKRGDYAGAMLHWHAGNSAKRKKYGALDRAMLSRWTRQSLQFVSAELRSAAEDLASTDPRPVLVVGMPRSGTTLVEQIISTHSKAYGRGELQELWWIERRLMSRLQPMRDKPSFAVAARALIKEEISNYLNELTQGAPNDSIRIVDKAPLNFLRLGLIQLMFPLAHVIWCRRDARDLAISTYSENMAPEARFATDLDDIAHYAAMQEQVMHHWQHNTQLPILEVQYERLVQEPRVVSKAMIEFLGLNWEQDCLSPHLGRSVIHTPSRWQVQQPIHHKSVGRWRHYSEHFVSK
ncbi:sulfotransferase [Pseudoxanthomonas kalamensis]|uniref:sulfotransferase n=1 Tax=Pseudoxanthomonas kalamensis TaxID=289483 RepID=UPI001390D534|nr:sulfotransferase [Pseudoxanthomonas kalamensis]